MNADESFGSRIRKLREQKGLTQKEVAARISTYYADDSSYRRIENGARTPSRDAVIAIAVTGLEIGDREQVDSLLALTGHEGLTPSQAEALGIAGTAVPTTSPSEPGPAKANEARWSVTFQRHREALLSAIPVAVASWFLCSGAEGGPWYPFTAVLLYAFLYVVSLFLESVYVDRHRQFVSVATAIFAMVLFTSAVGLWADRELTARKAATGLTMALSIFLLAAAIQWFLSRLILPARTIVPTRYLSHTSQAAHLKNTLYFLIVVFVFWLPPAHAVAFLRIGNPNSFDRNLGQMLIVAPGGITLGPGLLIGVLLLLVLISIPMRTQLLDNLKRAPKHGDYVLLFYLRAVLYFLLCLVCVCWFANAISQLHPK